MPGYHLPWFAAVHLGLDKQHGLQLELVEPEPGPDNVRAVAAGRYDLCLTSVKHYLTAKQADPAVDAQFIFMVARRSHMAAIFIRGRPAAHGRPIEDFGDLPGASVLGEADSPFVGEHQALLERLGGRDAPLAEVPYSEVMLRLAEGAGDIAPDHLDLLPTYASVARPVGLSVRALPYYKSGLAVYGSGLVAGSRLIAERPKLLQRATAMARDALLATRDDPTAGLDALCARFPATNRQYARDGWAHGAELIFGARGLLGEMDETVWCRTIEHFVRAHGGRAPDPKQVFDSSFVATTAAA